jgi:HEPN superfamily RES-like protein/RES domain-containing protein
MGLAKRLLEKELERGYQLTDDGVCCRCFEDNVIRSFIGANLTECQCSFCGDSAEEPVACPLDKVIEHMIMCIRDYYSDAESESVPYDREEDRYIIPTRTVWELLQYELSTFPMHSKALTQRILNAIPDVPWCKKNPELLSRAEGLRLGWREFCHAIKHDTRYLFFRRGDGDEPEFVEPADMLQEIGALINNFDLVLDIPKGTQFFRARCTEKNERFISPAEVGPPPSQFAPASRMSAAGIALFYGAMDPSTALAETRRRGDICGSVGEFETLVPLRLLDLVHMPDIPSLFGENRHLRDEVNFLWDFRKDAVSPVDPVARDYEYSPTQVVAEYIRRGFEYKGAHLDGIVYPSSKPHLYGGRNYVFFSDGRSVCGVTDDILSKAGTKKFRMLSVLQYDLTNSE